MSISATLPRSATALALPGPGYALPPLPRRGERQEGLSPGQRRVFVGAIVAAHVAGLWALMQVREVREAMAEAAPMFVSLIAPPAPPKPVPPPPVPVPQPVLKRPPPPVNIIAAAPSPAPAPAAFVVPEPPPPAPPVVAEAPAPVIAPPAPPAPPAQPKIIPASAVQYLDQVMPEYPRMSKRLAETGRVVVRVYIDEGGLPKIAQVTRSSGHPRLDEAALSAAQKTRFRPYTENGQAVAGYAFIPYDFELEK